VLSLYSAWLVVGEWVRRKKPRERKKVMNREKQLRSRRECEIWQKDVEKKIQITFPKLEPRELKISKLEKRELRGR